MSGINNKLLTIIIPTYNRKEEVRENLENTIPMVMNYKDKVSIYVSDNASTDGTKEMVNEYVEKYPDNVSYYCQPENITASPNFNHAVHSVKSTYCYILSDDDRIFPGFLPSVIDLIQRYPDVGMFHFNFIYGLKYGRKYKLYYPQIDSYQERCYEDGWHLLYDFLDGPSLVSSNLFKRELWLAGSGEIKNDCPGYVWYSILCHGMVNYKCLYFQQPLLCQNCPQRVNYSSKFPLYHIVGIGRLMQYLERYNEGIYNQWINVSQKVRWDEICFVITDVSYSKEFYRNNKKEMLGNIGFLWLKLYFLFCLYVSPKWLSHLILKQLIRIIRIIGYSIM